MNNNNKDSMLPSHQLLPLSEFAIPCDTPGALLLWLEQIPLANISKSARLVFNALCQLHKTDFSPAQTYEVLEAFIPAVYHLSSSLRQRYLADTSLSPKQRRHIMGLAQALQNEMASGYGRIVYQSDFNLDFAIKATAVHRAMNYHNHILLRTFQLYYDAPEKLWANQYKLYQFAVDNSMLEQIVIDGVYEEADGCSIEALFKVSLLLSICNPHQLRPNDTELVYNSLHRWVDDCFIHQEMKANDLFAFCTQRDEPAIYQKLLTGNTDKWFGLSNERLVKNLGAMLANFAIEDHPVFSKTLLHHLERAWGSFPTRAFPRTTHSGDLKACVGLAATHHYINNELDVVPDLKTVKENRISQFNFDANSVRDFELSPMESDNKDLHPNGRAHSNNPTENPWQIIYRNNIVDAAVEDQQTIPRSQYKIHDWHLVNTSDSGYCICTAADFPNDVKVGELIGLQEEDEDSQCYWHIGSVRWIKYTCDDQIQIGIQLLAPNAIAVGIRNQTQKENQGDYLRALLLPAVEPLNLPSSLIAPILPYEKGDKVHLLNQNIYSDIKLGDCLQAGSSFKQFEFDELKHFGEEFKFGDLG